MRRYQPNPTPVFSTDPATGYVRLHPNNFTGCLGCGNATHVFKQCPARNDPLVLAPKPHQETITNIDDFIWRTCVSYRKPNSVTLPFEYPIARCNDSSDNFGDSHGQLLFFSTDPATGYVRLHPNNFTGCLGCGNATHVFKQ